jgi:nucleoside-diphosphate-sugar epimerase
MRCLVIGASGFIGQHLCMALSKEGHEIFALVRPGSNTEALDKIKNLKLIYGCFEDPVWLKKCNQVNVVYHLAVNLNKLIPDEHDAVFRELGNMNLKHMIYFSSICAAGLDLSAQPLNENQNPILKENDFYGLYKLSVEKKLKELAESGRYPVTVLRPTIVYGPGTVNNAYVLYKMIADRRLVLWDHGSNKMRFCYIDNLIRAAVTMLEIQPEPYSIYHVGDREGLTLYQYCEFIAKALGMKMKYRNHPVFGGRLMGYLNFITNRFGFTDTPATHFLYDTWTRSMEVDISKLLSACPGLQFIPCEEGVRLTADYYRHDAYL